MKTIKVKLLEKKVLGEKLYELKFTRPFDFKAGQFVAFIVADKVKRFYSIASSPREESMNLLVTTEPGGPGSAFFEKIQEGDEAEIIGPMGNFLFNSDGNATFIATGTGVAPLIGIIEDQLNNDNQSQFNLLIGVRYEHNLFWQDKLKALSRKFYNFSYKYTLTRPTENWIGLKGRVTDYLHKAALDSSADYYVCGMKEMVLETKQTLLERGVKEDKIHYELY